MTVTDDDIRFARRRARRERRIASIQKSLSIKGSWVPVSGRGSHSTPDQTANWYRAFLRALRGRRFDDNKGRSQVMFLSSDPRAPMRATPELVEDMVGIFGDKIDDVDPNGERRPKNSPIVRSFLAKCWIRKEAYRQWDPGTYRAATQLLKWEFDDSQGRFNRDDEIIVPEDLQKARDKLTGTDRKAWPTIVKMYHLIEMGWATSATNAARIVCTSQKEIGIGMIDADIDRCRKLYSRLQKELEKGPA